MKAKVRIKNKRKQIWTETKIYEMDIESKRKTKGKNMLYVVDAENNIFKMYCWEAAINSWVYLMKNLWFCR